MVKQVIKMVWRRKKTFLGIYIEQVVVYIVLSFCLITASELLNRAYTPGLLDTDDIAAMIIPNSWSQPELAQKAHSLVAILKQSTDVVSISESINFAPYVYTQPDYDSLFVDHKMFEVKVKYTDENAYKIFQPKLDEGNWFTDAPRMDGSYTAVITKQLADELQWTSALGKQITFMQQKFTIVGVMEGLKEKALTDSPASLILPVKAAIYSTISSLYIVKYRPGQRDSFYSFFTKEHAKMYPELEDDMNFFDLNAIKKADLSGASMGVISMLLICCFVILYTFVGTYGVISLYSDRRVAEYALQMALGLTKRSLLYRVLLENLIVTLFSTLPGILIMLSILSSYTNKMAVVISMVGAILLMTLFSLFSAWLPAFKVSKLNPAEVLMNDL